MLVRIWRKYNPVGDTVPGKATMKKKYGASFKQTNKQTNKKLKFERLHDPLLDIYVLTN